MLSIIEKNFNLSIVIDFYRLHENLQIFPKKGTFLEKMEKKFLICMTIFLGKGSSHFENEYKLFYQKLDAKYFHVK